MRTGQLNQKARYLAESKRLREAADDAETLVNVLNNILDGSPELRWLMELAESWITAGYRLDHWRQRDRFERRVRRLPRRLTQRKSAPVQLDSGVAFQGG
jgi:hypothetical protein